MKKNIVVDHCISKIVNLQKENNKIIVAVAGLSRSGKSTLINQIQQKLSKQYISSISIPLDYWILPVKDRTSIMTVKDRYQYKQIFNDVSRLLKKGEVFIFPYEPLTRYISTKKKYISIKETQVVFFDGVISLDHPYINNVSTMKIFVEIDEELRKIRFANFYKLKGFSNKEIEELYTQRMYDENGIVMKSKNIADFVICEY